MSQSIYTILIIKESEVEREVYRRYLYEETSFNYDFWEAESGEVALNLCSRQLPDCIVLDYLLPDCNGLEFLEELKIGTGEKCPPIIMLNDQGNEEIAIRAFKTGVEDYLIESEITPESFRYVTRTAIENFRLRQRLRASEERYRAIVEDQTELICRSLPDCTLTFVNGAYSRYFNSTPEQLIGQNFLDLIPESHHNYVQQQIAELSGLTPENAVITHEHPVIKPNGEIGWQQWTNRAIFNSDGELVEIQAVGRDITDRKQTEIALQKTNERFEMVATVNCLIYDYDLQQNTIYRSQGLTELFGYSHREIEPTAEWWYERIHPSQREAIQEVKRAAVLGTETSVCLEYQVYHQDGYYIWVQDRGVIVRDESGQAVRIVGSTTDISNRKLIEQRLRESEERLQLGVRVAGIALARFDYASNTVELSPEAAVLYGFSSDELSVTRDRIHAMFHPEERELMEQIIEQVLDPMGDGWFERDHRVVWSNGEVRWLHVRKQVFFERLGDISRPSYAILAAIDITERKQAEATLRESERKFGGVFERAFQLMGLIGLDGIVLDINQAALDSIAAQKVDIVGQRFWETPWWTHSQSLQARLRDAIAQAATGQVIRFEVSFPNSIGTISTTDFSLKPIFEENNEIVLLIAEGRDISERIQSEAIIQNQLAQIEAIYATAPIGLCFLDHERRYVQLNERLAEINGLPVSEHIGRTIREILPELADIQEPIFEQVFQTGTPILDVEVQGTTPAQPEVERHWLVSYYPLTTADGQVLGINITVLEISDRKQAEVERERLLAEAQSAREAAEAANRDKDEFVAVVAHELRSPINSVAGWIQLLRTRQFDPATINRAYDAIERGTQTQVQLIEDLLDISRLACGTLRLTFAPINLTLVMQAALSLVRPMADAKQIHLETRMTEIAQVSGDLDRLQQIMVNLLTNAIKFTPEGGQVTITLELVERQARITVSDTGRGISPEFLPQIFEQFQQAQKNSGSKGGLGLGLAIVKNLVELHNGTITAESPGIGEGATFTVWLPLLESEPVTTPEEVLLTPEASPLAGIRILAVDDEPDSLELLHFILESAGAEVQTASSGLAALEILTQFNPDFVVSDIAMPDLNGHQLLQHIRSIYPERQIPAIALTAYASSSDRDYALRIGFEKYFSKPIEPEVLVAAIVSLV